MMIKAFTFATVASAAAAWNTQGHGHGYGNGQSYGQDHGQDHDYAIDHGYGYGQYATHLDEPADFRDGHLVAAGSHTQVLLPTDDTHQSFAVQTLNMDGYSLYTFDKDPASFSTCNGECLYNWPAFVAGHNDHAHDDFSIITREDGTRQWAHRNLPVHFFHQDVMPGDVNGDNFSQVWHLVKPRATTGSRSLRGTVKQATRVNVVQTTTIQQCTRMSGFRWNAHISKCERVTVQVPIQQCTRMSGYHWNVFSGKCERTTTTTTTIARSVEVRIKQCTMRFGYHWNAHSSKCERTTTTTTIARSVEVRIKQCRRSGRSWDHSHNMCLW